MPTRYKCGNGHVFLFPLVITEHTVKLVNTVSGLNVAYDSCVEGWFETVSHRCPVDNCTSIDIQEYIEPIEEKGEITALISVPNNEVNGFITQGYSVMEDKIYAKETILIRRAEVKQKDYVEVAKEIAAVASKTLDDIEANDRIEKNLKSLKKQTPDDIFTKEVKKQ